MIKKATIKDVAKASSVSVSAVSRVFNDYDDISEDTRRKVRAAAKELGYVANSAAKQHSSKQKRVVAPILNDINVTRGVAIPLEIIDGVTKKLDSTDFEFFLYVTNLEKQRQKSLTAFCGEHDVSGLIIQGLTVDDPYYQELSNFPLTAVASDLLQEREGVIHYP